MKNQRGISEVVTTLIFILLAIIAIGIVWYIFGNLSSQTQDQIDIGQKCLGMDVKPVGLGCSGTVCTVNVTRGIGNSEAFKGLRIVLIDSTGSITANPTGDVAVSSKVTKSVTVASGAVYTSVTVAPYFEINGVDTVCPNPQSYP